VYGLSIAECLEGCAGRNKSGVNVLLLAIVALLATDIDEVFNDLFGVFRLPGATFTAEMPFNLSIFQKILRNQNGLADGLGGCANAIEGTLGYGEHPRR